MKLHRLHRTQRLPITQQEAWDFFSDPRKLPLITPGWLDFDLTNEPPERVRTGTLITYRIRPIGRVPVRWVTEITHAEEPRRFVDEQRFGPYRFWHHEHVFRPLDGGGVEVEDVAHYAVPFGPIGALAHALTVRARLEAIFDYRRRALERHFGRWEPASTAV